MAYTVIKKFRRDVTAAAKRGNLHNLGEFK